MRRLATDSHVKGDQMVLEARTGHRDHYRKVSYVRVPECPFSYLCQVFMEDAAIILVGKNYGGWIFEYVFV